MSDYVLNNQKSDHYAPPRARVADTHASDDQTQPINLFSAKGRMGRLRYLCWTFVFTLVFGAITAIGMSVTFGAVFFAGAVGHPAANMKNFGLASVAGMLILFAIMIVGLIFIIKLLIQRAHDMNWSGWSVLALYATIFFIGIVAMIVMATTKSMVIFIILQIIIILISLIWAAKPGTPGPNRFGPPPPPTPLPVKIGAWIFIALMAVGLINSIISGLFISSKMQQLEQQMQQTRQPEQTE